MNRRDLFKLGATAAVPAGLSPSVAPAAQVVSPAWSPGLFDSHQNETVVALTDLIIPATDTPGAKAALVNRWIDKLLLDGPASQRHEFLEGLAWLDGFALRQHNAPFAACSPGRQTAMLDTLSVDGPEPEIAPGRRFFLAAKSLTARVYYNTEIGLQELNKGGRVPEKYGCADQG